MPVCLALVRWDLWVEVDSYRTLACALQIVDCSFQSTYFIVEIANTSITLTTQQASNFSGIMIVVYSQSPISLRLRAYSTETTLLFVHHLVVFYSETEIAQVTNSILF